MTVKAVAPEQLRTDAIHEAAAVHNRAEADDARLAVVAHEQLAASDVLHGHGLTAEQPQSAAGSEALALCLAALESA